MTPDYSGQLLANRYHLRRVIGLGGMATVYEAVDRELNKPVAVKVLNPVYASQPDYLARFRQEAREAARIRHEHLVDVTDQGSTAEGLAYFVMEFLRGETLQNYLHPGGDEARPLHWRDMVAIVVQVLDALQHAHEHGVIHRDIKPGNVFLLPRRSGGFRVKVLDLGIAKVAQAHRDPKAPPTTRASQGTPGTPEYMSPEQVRGAPCTPQTDLYSVGVLMYRMLTGTLPFYSDRSPYEIMDQHCKQAPEPPRTRATALQIPDAVEREVLRALAKRPEERHTSALELADTLRALEAAEADRQRRAAEDDELSTRQFHHAPGPGGRPLARLLSWLAAGLGTLTLSTTLFMVLVLFLPGARANPPTNTPPPDVPVVSKPPDPTPTSAPPNPPVDPKPSPPVTNTDLEPPKVPPPPSHHKTPKLPPEKQLKQFIRQHAQLKRRCEAHKLFTAERVAVKLKLPPAGGRPTELVILTHGASSRLADCVRTALSKLTYPALDTTSFPNLQLDL
jgi:serine/threonine-protein kinase